MTVPQWMRGECLVDGRAVRLLPAWSELLAVLLVASPDRELSSAELIEAIWPEPDEEPAYAAGNLAKYIHFLRARGVPIENRHGYGWRIPAWARGCKNEAERLAA